MVVVDDDADLLRLVERLLARSWSDALKPRFFDDPRAAQEMLNQGVCDVLLSDLQMPGVDGMEMLRFAKRRNAWTQVVFLTGHASWDSISEAIAEGASDYLLKPIQSRELDALVGETVARFGRWQAALRGSGRNAQLAAATR